jgi:hypothetical protein
MKSILLFSNPFGYGPSGKLLSIAKYLSKNTTQTEIILCGSQYLAQIARSEFRFIHIEDRDEEAISKLLKNIPDEKYVLSSQNRFAIKATIKNNIPSAFLDGLAWFWNKFPDDHFLADIIFWLNYPDIKKSIPEKFKDKINIIHGITEPQLIGKGIKRNGIIMYIGGCKNPLTPMPYSYLDLIAKLFDTISIIEDIEVCMDSESQLYLKKRKISERFKRYGHSEFIQRLANSKMLITNGGQSATLESVSVNTPISFFLPINLSQFALIQKLNTPLNNYPHLNWNNYVDISKNISDFSEAEALKYLEIKSKELLSNPLKFERLCDDFKKILNPSTFKLKGSKIFEDLGSTGSADIYKILKNKWKIQ